MGKTESEDYTVEKIKAEYGLKPIDLIEVKGLMGDTSDNIPGVPGVGEKTAISLIRQYKTIDELYNNLEEQKGKLKERLEQNKELAYLSRTLGTIDINAPIEKDLNLLKIKKWNNKEVLEVFRKLKFNRFIERFNLNNQENAVEADAHGCPNIITKLKLNNDDIQNIKKIIQEEKSERIR